MLNRELLASPLDCRASWRHWNPGLRLRLWTYHSLRALMAERQPDLLPIIDGSARGVAAAFVGRYLLLQQFGGVVADLDCQCLQPIAPLLQGQVLVMAAEPETRRSVCPAFLASVPGHAFWREVLAAIACLNSSTWRCDDQAIAALGSALLTSLLEADSNDSAALLPSQLLYPFTPSECRDGLSFDPVVWSNRCRQAYVTHHWQAWRVPSGRAFHAGFPAQALVNVQEPRGASAPEVQGPEPEPDLPLISALMVTRGRPRQAQLAIQTFRAQTYPNRELVVVDDDSDPTLARWISTQADPHIRLVRLSDAQQTLGELRNLALEQAHGLYVCQWDDDDLHDPLRLEVQLQTLRARGAQASLLARWMIWWPQHQRLALSCYRNWEGSLLCRRSLMPAYPCLRRGEDSQLLEQLSNSVRVARIDMPRLYLYVVHGTNTFEQEHFETHWHQATARWQGSELDRLLPELQRRMPIHVYRRILDGGSAGAGAEVVHHPCA